MAKFKIKGLRELQRDLTKMERSIPLEVDKEIAIIARDILNDAISRVPIDKGELKGSSFIERIDAGWVVGFSIKYAPYVEFGGGAGVLDIPLGYEDYALTFKVDGSGRNIAQPFLFPAFLSRRDKITDDLEVKLRDFLRSI